MVRGGWCGALSCRLGVGHRHGRCGERHERGWESDDAMVQTAGAGLWRCVLGSGGERTKAGGDSESVSPRITKSVPMAVVRR